MAHPQDENTGIIVQGSALRARLEEEIERSKRYEHPFSVLTLRPPTMSNRDEVLATPWFDSLVRSLVRGCDVVAVLGEAPTIAVLLPETDVSGAGAVLERLRGAIEDPDHEWEFALYEYPSNSEAIDDLMELAA